MSWRDFVLALSTAFAPSAPNAIVHESRNIRAAVEAGQARAAKLSRISGSAATNGNSDGVRHAAQKQSEILSALNETARRLDE